MPGRTTYFLATQLVRTYLPLWLACLTCLPAPAQQPGTANLPFLVERLEVRSDFESDGRALRTTRLRIRVQNEEGAEQLRQFAFRYNADHERAEFRRVEVTRPDGSVLAAGPENVTDTADPATEAAPGYRQVRRLTLNAPSLGPGDTLEYEIAVHLHTPFAPGKLWFPHRFATSDAVRSETVEVSLPAGADYRVKSRPGAEPEIRESKGKKIYRWMRTPDGRSQPRKGDGPDIQITSFESWDELGTWFALLFREASSVTPAIRARAGEITAGVEDQRAKAEAIYAFVATKIRSVNFSLGEVNYNPHAADEVLANGYADAKDKHVLLAALCAAAGLRAEAVLAHRDALLDAEAPMPAQFNHVFSLVRLPAEEFWLDASAEVAPFGLVEASLRGRDVLVVPPEGAPRIRRAPEAPPFAGQDHKTVAARVTASGELTARVEARVRGDGELYLRRAFRNVPRQRWDQVGDLLAAVAGLGGSASETASSAPADLRDPFSYRYQTTRGNFFAWDGATARIDCPAPPVPLVEPDEAAGSEAAVVLAGPAEASVLLRLELPPGVTVSVPTPISIRRDYAEYRSSYRTEGGTLHVERHLRLNSWKLPPERARDYLAFVRSVRADEQQRLVLLRAAPPETVPQDPR